PPTPPATLFPYTTLFRSCKSAEQRPLHRYHRRLVLDMAQGLRLFRERLQRGGRTFRQQCCSCSNRRNWKLRKRPNPHQRLELCRDRKSTRLNSSHVSISY